MGTKLHDHQGGKKFGELKKQQEDYVDNINKEFSEDETYKEVEDLEAKLLQYKKKFIEFDLDNSGDIDFMELKQMLEKMDQAKTHAEAKKMLKEVAIENQETITYRDFLNMMLGKKNSVLRLIILFEEKATPKKTEAKGPAPKKSFDQLP